MKKRTKKVAIMVICTLFMLTISSVAQAYVVTGFRWSSNSIKYYYDNYISSTAKTALSSGASSWSGVDASFSFNSSYNIYCLETYNSNVTWDGITTHYLPPTGNYFSTQTVQLNSAKPAWNNAAALKSVAGHEFGHCFGLYENGATQTIMNDYTYGTNSRYGTYGITTPQTDDKNGVNYIY